VPDQRQARSSSGPGDKAHEATESAERAKDQPGEANHVVDEILEDIDRILGEINYPEQWVSEFVQKDKQ